MSIQLAPFAPLNAQLQPVAPSRLIAVAVRDEDRDLSTLAWAVAEAVPGLDTLHVVHAFAPLKIDGCVWLPVTSARDRRRGQAQLVLARALQRLRVAHTGLEVDGSVVQGTAAEVLIEFSDVVDLLVLGEDDVIAGGGATQTRTTTGQVVRGARCPVINVPRCYRREDVDPRSPVTVVVDTLELPQAAVEFGFVEADRRGTSLCVAQFWAALHEEGPRTAELIADRQRQLDTQLGNWQLRWPSVGITAELRLDDGEAALLDLQAASQLLVIANGSARLLAAYGGSTEGCATALVPGSRATES